MTKYNDISENKLYVLTDIDEFLYDYGIYKQTIGAQGIYNEMRAKQFMRFFDVITDMFKENYIILSGKEKENLTMEDLNRRFKEIRKTSIVSDRLNLH